MKFVGRISGIVAYSDDTTDQFAAHRDERGNISVNSGVNDTVNESGRAIATVQASNNWLEGMLDLVSATLVLAATGSSGKTVSSAALHFSGRVALDDDTWEDFAVQYDGKAGGEFILNSSGSGGDVSAYSEFLSAVLTPWLEEITGSGTVTAP